MIELQDGILLYHGSYIGIPEIDLNRCFGGLDFGRGFYLTSSYEQAYNYVHLSPEKPYALVVFQKISILKMVKYLSISSTMIRIYWHTVFREQPSNGSTL